MPKFRKKPVVIEAVQWCGHNFIEVDAFVSVPHETFPADGYMIIPTLEGDHRANLNDWIIKGVQGDYYPCKPDIFEQTYELLDESSEGDAQ